MAIFGLTGWRWEWAPEIREVIFCLDADELGQEARQEISRAAAMRGKRVFYLPTEAFGGHKDISDAWGAGGLQLAEPTLLDEMESWPAERKEG